ncbi:MarR family winged helix-turn-helix transcriptional regulator [Corallococcus sp. RDP092CA]|uniref:MarR family winged helix-turn-helix transcriptional regulator n=1 Tax=Corallococcus sp. RDP092CA TaxID=3109369 RepID=UPI0035B07618
MTTIKPAPPKAPSRAELEAAFLQELTLTVRGWRRMADLRFAKLGLSSAVGTAMLTIEQRDGLAQGELARELGVEAPTVVRLVDQLCELGFIVRQTAPTDRRVKRLVLTKKGHELTRKLLPIRTAVQEEALADVTDADLQGCLKVLSACQQSLTRLSNDP